MRFGIDTLVVGTLAVTTAWALVSQDPIVERTPYPLPASAQASAARWDAQAEEAFGLSAGTGVQAMTEQEWQTHQQKMSAMSAAERKRYQKLVRQRIVERVRTGRAPASGDTTARG